jgi:hypothetical protein
MEKKELKVRVQWTINHTVAIYGLDVVGVGGINSNNSIASTKTSKPSVS